jgi:hypothetical protein
MKQLGIYFVAMVLGLVMVAGPVLAQGREVERPLKTAVHVYDDERPYWSKVLED